MLLAGIREYSGEHSESIAFRDYMLSSALEDFSTEDISAAEKGKPFLKSGAAGFSVSHTEGAVLCCLNTAGNLPPPVNENGIFFVFPCGKDINVGADIEALGIRQIKSLERICQKRFSAAEQKLVEKSGNKERAILELWTKKEAYLKFTGEGISGLKNADTERLKEAYSFYTESIKFGDKEFVFSLCVQR